MDSVQFTSAAPLAAPEAFPRPEAVTSIAEVSGVMARAGDAPLPHGLGQVGEVNKSRMADATGGKDSEIAPERVLKPWGLPMLPDLAKQEAAREEESERGETQDTDGLDTTSQEPAAPELAVAPTEPEAVEPQPATIADPSDPARPEPAPYQSEPQPA